MKRLFAISVLLAAFSVQAHELNFWQKVNNLLTKVNDIDSVYVYQPNQSFTLGMFSTVQQVGFDTKVMFNFFGENDSRIPGTTKYHFNEKPSTKLGLEVGYGKFVLGYGLEVSPKNGHKRFSLGLNLLGKNWGLHSNFFKISNDFRSKITVGNTNDINYWEDEIIGTEPASMSYLSIDGYYVFNNKRFAYPAAYKAGLVQRKTAGSWMVTGRYMQGRLKNPPGASHDEYFMFDGFNTMQISVGGGYSANFVCWHRDPTVLHDKGLRNLTINLTLLPVITAFNYLKTISYHQDTGEPIEDDISTIYCYPMPNFIGNSAISLTLDRFFISTQFTYNWFYFHSAQAIDPTSLPISAQVDDISFRGSFYNWNLKLLFMYKF